MNYKGTLWGSHPLQTGNIRDVRTGLSFFPLYPWEQWFMIFLGVVLFGYWQIPYVPLKSLKCQLLGNALVEASVSRLSTFYLPCHRSSFPARSQRLVCPQEWLCRDGWKQPERATLFISLRPPATSAMAGKSLGVPDGCLAECTAANHMVLLPD